MIRKVTVAAMSQAIIALGVVLMIHASLGADPWTAFTLGWSNATGLTNGRVTQLTMLALVCANYLVGKQKPGIGAAFNIVLVGWFIDLLTPVVGIPGGLFVRWMAQLAGMVLMALGSAAYIHADLGRGPIDGWGFTMGRLLHTKIGIARIVTDGIAVSVGAALGGKVGVGTLAAAVLIGPLIQFFITRGEWRV
ncbi:MAG: hypothetical protein VB144_09025 [Clostridia bacterium]|nr:hypothetical protein [Clostridia bacterium]